MKNNLVLAGQSKSKVQQRNPSHGNPIIDDYLNSKVPPPKKESNKSLKKRGQSIGGQQNYLYDERNESPTKIDDSPKPRYPT